MITAMQDTDSDDEDIVVLITANGGGYDAVTTGVAVRVDDDEDSAVAEEPEEPEASAGGLPVFLLVPTVAFPQVAIHSNDSSRTRPRQRTLPGRTADGLRDRPDPGDGRLAGRDVRRRSARG